MSFKEPIVTFKPHRSSPHDVPDEPGSADDQDSTPEERVRVNFVLPRSERERFAAAARASGQTLTSWFRSIGLRAAREVEADLARDARRARQIAEVPSKDRR